MVLAAFEFVRGLVPLVPGAGGGEGWPALWVLSGAYWAWYGLFLLWGRVKVTERWASSAYFSFHRWPRAQVVAIDVRRKDSWRSPRTVPYVVLKNGRSFPLFPLERRIAPPRWQRAPVVAEESQQELVDELRLELGVGGSDLAKSLPAQRATAARA
jgi:hypothetical protein